MSANGIRHQITEMLQQHLDEALAKLVSAELVFQC
jgi:hypothetical protein